MGNLPEIKKSILSLGMECIIFNTDITFESNYIQK